MGVELTIWGTRGSIAAAHPRCMGFGGNTSCYTLRTPANTLIFLDAGTGILEAQSELDVTAKKVVLALSHSHADHIQGLGLPNRHGRMLGWLPRLDGYGDQKVHVYGPHGVMAGLNRYFDGEQVWPVTTAMMDTGLDLTHLIQIAEGHVYEIDASTVMRTMYGNHPVEGGVALYRFEMHEGDRTKVVVYATDNEFDYRKMALPNTDAAALKGRYVAFIKDADIVIADAQYDTAHYESGEPYEVKGFGHSHPQQIIDLAHEAGVRLVLLTHHDRAFDDELEAREERIRGYTQGDLDAFLARERDVEGRQMRYIF